MRYFINKEKEGWVCVSWSSFGRLEEPKISHQSVCFTRMCGFYLDGVSDLWRISGGYDNKRSWHFQKKLGSLRKKIGIPEGVVFHTLRNTFATRMKNLGIPRNHISQIMGHEDSNMALTVYSSGIVIEGLVESINKLTYEEVDSFIKDTLKNSKKPTPSSPVSNSH